MEGIGKGLGQFGDVILHLSNCLMFAELVFGIGGSLVVWSRCSQCFGAGGPPGTTSKQDSRFKAAPAPCRHQPFYKLLRIKTSQTFGHQGLHGAELLLTF